MVDSTGIICPVFAVPAIQCLQLIATLDDGAPTRMQIESPLFPLPVARRKPTDPPPPRVTRFKLTKDLPQRQREITLRQMTTLDGKTVVQVRAV